MFSRSNLWAVIILFAFCTLAVAQSNNPDLDGATQGDPAAQLRLAKAYHTGTGRPHDMREAIRWYYAAASKGSGEAAYNLGILAYNGDVLGDNIRQSDVQAWVWFDAAAVAGYPEAAEARDRIGADLIDAKLRQAHETAATLFLNGGRFPANPASAIKELEWINEHSASGGATIFLANLYIDGQKIPKDLEKAKVLCEKAEKAHYVGANYCLGLIQSENGNATGGFNLIRKDAELAYPNAMLDLAKRYRDGNGTKSDPTAAYTWVLRCDAIRVQGCEELKQELASKLSDNEQKKAEKEAAKMKLPSGLPIMDALKRPAKPVIINHTKNNHTSD
jgi:TPR repeat protein